MGRQTRWRFDELQSDDRNCLACLTARPPNVGAARAPGSGGSGKSPTAGCWCAWLNDEGSSPDDRIRGRSSELFESGFKDIRHVAPGVLWTSGVSLFWLRIFPASGKASSRTRAKQAILTDRAPALRRTSTQRSAVAPLVKTSSTRITSAPSM